MFSVKTFITPLLILIVQNADIDWEEPTNLLILRATFGVVMTLTVGVNLMIYSKINSKLDERRCKVKPQRGEEGIRDLTFTEYDKEQFLSQVRALGMSLIMTCVFHFQYKWVFPLVVSCFHQPVTVYEHPLFQIHMLGESDTGSESNPFKRPWSTNNGFDDIMRQAKAMDPSNREAAEKRAEKKKAGKLNKALKGARK